MRTARHTGIACLAVLFCMFPSALGVSASAPTRWDARLEALDPTRPLDYFLLGEEVADAAVNEAERQLARELFGLAGALDRDRLARSAALGQARKFSTALGAEVAIPMVATLIERRSGSFVSGMENSSLGSALKLVQR